MKYKDCTQSHFRMSSIWIFFTFSTHSCEKNVANKILKMIITTIKPFPMALLGSSWLFVPQRLVQDSPNDGGEEEKGASNSYLCRILKKKIDDNRSL